MPETSVYMQKGGPDCSILKGVSENASHRVYAVGSPFTQIGMVDKFCSTATVL